MIQKDGLGEKTKTKKKKEDEEEEQKAGYSIEMVLFFNRNLLNEHI